MHSVQRSQVPGFFDDLRHGYSGWQELNGQERRRVRAALAEDFAGICGYCEQECQNPTRAELPSEESVDHFHPRSRFPSEWLDWLNLVYSCRRCNQAKGSQWPAIGDADNRRLRIINRYREVSAYVGPNQVGSQPTAETFFTFDMSSGEIVPADELADTEWSLAYRTIDDLDLNSLNSAYSVVSLPNQRRVRGQLLDETLEQVPDPELRSVIVTGLVQRDRPFSSFMAAYARAIGFEV